MTWVSMLKIDQARELAQQHADRALDLFKQVGGENEFLLQLTDHMLNRQK